MSQVKRQPVVHIIPEEDSKICCPPKESAVWNLHPRVYLAIDSSNEVSCPYCGDIYRLERS